MTEEELIMWDDLMGVNMTEEGKQQELLDEEEEDEQYIFIIMFGLMKIEQTQEVKNRFT